MGKFTVDFSGDKEIQDAIDKELISLELAQKKIILEFFKRIVLKTPVRFGTARANWQISFNAPAVTVLDKQDKTGNNVINEITTVLLNAKFDKNINVYLSNNLPYIEVLENGSSTQAPAGMIKSTIPEFNGIIKENENEL